MKSLVKLLTVSLAAFTLTACAPSSPADVLKAGPETTANFIAEALESGNGTKLCELINQIDPGRCEGLLNSSGLGSKPTPKIQAFFGDAVQYSFTEGNPDWGRYQITLNALPYNGESGRQWQYQISDSFASINQPFGVKYDGQEIEAGESAEVMPGEYRSKLVVRTDAANWFKHSYKDGEDKFTLSDKALRDMTTIVENRCIEAQKTEAPTKENIRRFAGDDFTVVSITQLDKCENIGKESILSMTPNNVMWSANSTYEVKGYKMIRFWGKQNRDLTVRQGFTSNWKYENGKWNQEDYDFYGD
jgi:hypothetical protein